MIAPIAAAQWRTSGKLARTVVYPIVSQTHFTAMKKQLKHAGPSPAKILFRNALWFLAFLDFQIVYLLGCLLLLALILILLAAFVSHYPPPLLLNEPKDTLC